jgi:hypothetical protein
LTTVRRIIVAAVLGAFAGATALVLFYALKPGVVLDMGTDLPPIARGFYPIERDPQGLTFVWTRDRAELALPGLDRRVAWTTTVRVRGGRADPATLPDVQLAVDGVVRATRRADNTFQDLSVEVPAAASERGTVLTLLVSSTFVPGPGDRRALGVMVDEIRIAPAVNSVALVPRRTLGGAMIACGLFGIAFAAIGLTSVPAVGAAVVLAMGQAAVLVRGVGPYLPYGGKMAWFAFGITVLLVAATWAAERWSGQRVRNTARFAAGVAASALYLKLLVLLHPAMPVGDAVFHAHRLEWVLDGRLFFTSVAPGGYQLPSAIGLYGFAAPFVLFGTDLPFLVGLLRTVVATADALAGLLLYLMVLRASGDRVAGAMAVALFQLVPLAFGVQATGDLANAFGQSLFLVTLSLISLGVVRQRAPRGVVVATLTATAAALSHTSTFAIATPVLLLVAAAFAWRGNDVLRTSARPIATVALLCTTVAVGVYYAHFWDTYRDELARLGSEIARPTAESAPGGRGIATRAALVPHHLWMHYGLPLLVLAATGVAWFWARRQRDRLALTLCGWSVGCAGFLAAGVLTPVDMRYYLAFFPAVAILGALGAAWLWRSGRGPRVAAAGLLTLAVVRGVAGWLSPLTGWTASW